MYFDQRYTYSTTSKSLINSVKIIKSHGNDQSGGPFGYCFRYVLWGVWFCMSLNIHPALWESINCDKTCKKIQETTQTYKIPRLLLKQYCFELRFFYLSTFLKMQGAAVGWIKKKLNFPNFGERCQAAGVFSTFFDFS